MHRCQTLSGGAPPSKGAVRVSPARQRPSRLSRRRLVTEPRAAIFGCAGPRLEAGERDFFRAADPLGFILFARNAETPDQLRALVAELRAAVGRAAPVLIDQEGGRVQRLRPPHWRAAPPAGRFGALAAHHLEAAARAVWINARLIAAELHALGIDVDCAPVLDNTVPGGHAVIGDRAFGSEPWVIASLGRAMAEGLMAGGVLPMIKHLPGHGRAATDSHDALPVVTSPAAELEATDLPPFRALADAPFAMTAHIVYTAPGIRYAAGDALRPPSSADVIRNRIGFRERPWSATTSRCAPCPAASAIVRASPSRPAATSSCTATAIRAR